MTKQFNMVLALTFILFLAACGGADNNDDADQTEENNTANGETLTIQAMNFQFDQEEYSVPAGEMTIELENAEGNHGIIIKGANEGEDIVLNSSGSTMATLEPGEYQIECSIPCGSGHSDMVSTLIVT
ncbi:hypothetical protein [Bacillus sp. JCM 19041]|uniref:hypothetical protein n=1 Tax=Bacillus sp. JCM 19041 TaxID=1460637 RepID=UPI0006D1AC0B